MSAPGAPILEPRGADQFVAALLQRLPAYVPGWQPRGGGPADAMLRIYARFLDALGERIDRTPDKNELAFLDLLGLELLPAQAARAPLVFQTLPQLGDGHAPAGTRVGAKNPAGGDPIVFETESAVALASARIAEVVTVWPGRDAYADHSANAIGGKPFTLWEPLQPIRHELYLAHSLYFALTGQATVSLDVELATAGSAPLAITWQYWDGRLWRDFKDLQPGDDSTAGLTRTGAVVLHSDCAQSAPTTVGGTTSCWLRGILVDPLPPDASRTLPQVDRISMRTVLQRDVGADCTTGLLPDAAFAETLKLDLTKPFQPLGPAPGAGTAFYLTSTEAFAHPGATVTICLNRPKTAQEQADEQSDAYAADITAIIAILLSIATSCANELADIGESVIALGDPQDMTVGRFQGKVDAVRSAATTLVDLSGLDALAQAASDLAGLIAAVPVDVDKVQQSVPNIGATETALDNIAADLTGAASVAADVGSWAAGIIDLILQLGFGIFTGDALGTGARQQQCGQIVEALGNAVLELAVAGNATNQLSQRVSALHDSLGNIAGALGVPDATANAAAALAGVSLDLIWETDSVVDENATRQRIRSSDAESVQAATEGSNALAELAKLSPFDVGAAVGVAAPALDPPKLAWEYWDGSAWQSLAHTEAAPNIGVGDLMTSGSITFTVPADWESNTVNGTPGLWLRARLSSGVYGRLRIVSWVDTQTKRLNVIPVIEPRPPELKALRIGYQWTSDPASPERCLTLNDFQWADRTEEAGWHGNAFAPFSPTDDSTPALYLGFDRPLPTDLVGLFLDIDEVVGETAGPALDWQCWDGAGWSRVTVNDETAGLALPGIADVLWPGVDAPPAVPFAAAAGATVRLNDARTGAAFASGDLLWIAAGDTGELATVDSVAGDTIALQVPLAGSYARGTVGRAGLPRFGVPRTWLRARLRTDGDPRRATVEGVYTNAVWASQIQTIGDELLGSATGQPRQTLFFSRTPVLHGETVEVRELDGPRAAVEYPLLVAEVALSGISETSLRTVVDRSTGKIVEVWVPWQGRPNLLFSGPGDRHYTLERSHGRLIFGDGVNGRIPPAGANAIRARSYRSGGGQQGNVPAGAISQALSAVVVQGVANPLPAEGGAQGEPDEAVLARGPLTLRNRRQALSADDYEALAREASPAVALARALPATRPGGRPAPGWVTVVVVPWSPDAEPQPSFELRREVSEFLLVRAPAALAGRLGVVGPTYRRVGVDAVIAPLDASAGGVVTERAREAIVGFLHPLTGGPGGKGWAAQREVCLSSVATLLEQIDGVDYVESLLLLDRGTVAGDVLAVGPDRLVAAGPVQVRLTGDGS